MNEIISTAAPVIFSIVGFFAARFFGTMDKTAGEAGVARERIGQLEMRIDAAFREIDHQKERIKELREDLKDRAS